MSSPTQRVFYGNAEPSGKTVKIGGARVVVDGWAASECAHRKHAGAPARTRYPGRTYVQGQDALESILGARADRAAGPRGNPRMADPLTRSVGRLAAALEAFTAAVVRGKSSPGRFLALPPDAPIAVASITADDVRQLGPAANVRDVYHMVSAVGDFATAYAPKDMHPALRLRRPRDLPPVPDTTVSIFESTADQDILSLEAEVLELAELVETYQGVAAGVLDLAAEVLEKVVTA
jgi:hypothetical protein